MDITEQQQELIESNGGEVTPELASQLLEQAMFGDTAAESTEKGSEPNPTQVSEEAKTPDDTAGGTQQGQEHAQQQQQADESQLNAENAYILAKDGKHTIPYDKLVEARNGEREWKQKYDDAQQQLAQLQADAQERKDNGQAQPTHDHKTEVVQEAVKKGLIDPSIFGDFSETSVTDGVEKAFDILVEKKLEARIQALLAPILQTQQVSAEQAHFNEIYTAHPDAESVVESKEFNDWKSAQPSFIQSAYDAVLNQGSAAQVVELLGLYKSGIQSTQAAQQQQNTDAVRAAAQQAVSQAQTQVPNSLSDLPAGSPAGVSRDERFANMSPAELAEEMQGWTQEQREQYMNRHV